MLVVAIENIATSILKDQSYEVTDQAGEAVQIADEWYSLSHFKTKEPNGPGNSVEPKEIRQVNYCQENGDSTSCKHCD
jgi:hypothetical protein